MVVLFDVLSGILEHKANMVTAMVAWREYLPVYACHFVFIGVPPVVDYSINTGSLNLFARFELIANSCVSHKGRPSFSPSARDYTDNRDALLMALWC